MAQHSRASDSPRRAPTPKEDCEGDTGRQMGQGESPATFVTPLVQRQSACCEAGDRKSRQTDSWRGRRNLGYAKQKSTGDLSSAAKGISPSATTTNLYPTKEWCDPFPLNRGDTGDEGQGL